MHGKYMVHEPCRLHHVVMSHYRLCHTDSKVTDLSPYLRIHCRRAVVARYGYGCGQPSVVVKAVGRLAVEARVVAVEVTRACIVPHTHTTPCISISDCWHLVKYSICFMPASIKKWTMALSVPQA